MVVREGQRGHERWDGMCCMEVGQSVVVFFDADEGVHAQFTLAFLLAVGGVPLSPCEVWTFLVIVAGEAHA